MSTAIETIPPCTGGSAPECCTPIPPAFLSARAYAESLPPGAWRETCPACGSRWIAPLFLFDPDEGDWDCLDCCAIFNGRPNR